MDYTKENQQEMVNATGNQNDINDIDKKGNLNKVLSFLFVSDYEEGM